jgi:hypothetical protein
MRLSRPLSFLASIVAAVAIASSACGGKTETLGPHDGGGATGPGSGGSSSGSSGGSSTGGSSSGSGGSQPGCPASPPAGGSPCAAEGLVCDGSMWGGGCAPNCSCMGHAWACYYPPCLQTSCPATAPAQYSQCYNIDLVCPYPNAQTCTCESPGTWFCNAGGGTSGGSSGSSSGAGTMCPISEPVPGSPCSVVSGEQCGYPASPCGLDYCTCGSGTWLCFGPDCVDAGTRPGDGG